MGSYDEGDEELINKGAQNFACATIPARSSIPLGYICGKELRQRFSCSVCGAEGHVHRSSRS